MKIMSIYRILNNITGKFYIGSSNNTNRRWKKHKYELNLNKHSNTKLQNSWNLHGENAFEFAVLQIIYNEHDLMICEQIWVNVLKPYEDCTGYNIRKTVNSNRGLNFTEEHKAKIGLANKGKIRSKEFIEFLKTLSPSEETRKLMSIAKKGHIKSEENRAKLSKFHLNRKHSQSHINNVANSLKGRKQSSEELKNKGRQKWKWPHDLGVRCKCDECRAKKSKIQSERYKRLLNEKSK